MMRRPVIAAVVAAAAVLLSACTGGGGGGSESSSQPVPSSSAAALPFSGAPKVPNPLPASVLGGDPCTDALTPEQVKTAIGIEKQGERDDLPALGAGCRWS